jgi:hypothetical protein
MEKNRRYHDKEEITKEKQEQRSKKEVDRQAHMCR